MMCVNLSGTSSSIPYSNPRGEVFPVYLADQGWGRGQDVNPGPQDHKVATPATWHCPGQGTASSQCKDPVTRCSPFASSLPAPSGYVNILS